MKLPKAANTFIDYLHLEMDNALYAALGLHSPTPHNAQCALYLRNKQNNSKDPSTSFNILDARIVPFSQIVDPSGVLKAANFTRAGLDSHYNLNRFPADWVRTFALVVAEGQTPGEAFVSHRPVALPLMPEAEHRAPKLWKAVTSLSWEKDLKESSKLVLNADFSGPRGLARKALVLRLSVAVPRRTVFKLTPRNSLA